MLVVHLKNSQPNVILLTKNKNMKMNSLFRIHIIRNRTIFIFCALFDWIPYAYVYTIYIYHCVQTDPAKIVWTRAYLIPERNRTVRRR